MVKALRAVVAAVLAAVVLMPAEAVGGSRSPFFGWVVRQHDAARTGRTTAIGPQDANALWRVPRDVGGGLVVAPDGTIYAGSAEHVLRIHPDGHSRSIFTMDRSMTNSPAIAPDGSILLVPESGTVYDIDRNGTLLWKYETGEYVSVEGSPVVSSDGTIYVGGKRLWAFTPDGSVRWTLAVNSYVAAPTAIARDGTLYTADAAGTVYAIDGDGNVRWTAPDLGSVGSVAVGPDALYLNTHDNVVTALDFTGRLLWKHQIARFVVDSPSSPGLSRSGTIYAGGGYGTIAAFDPAGHRLWVRRVDQDLSDATVDGYGTLYIGDDSGNLYAINPNGSLRWRLHEPSSGFATGGLAIVPGRVYAAGSSIVAIEAA